MLGHARGVLGARSGRFGEQDGALLAALADLATIAIHNAELIRELGRSREETPAAPRPSGPLREIAARVTSIRDADAILGLIVDETRRVLGLGRRPPDPDVRRPDVPHARWSSPAAWTTRPATGCAARSSRSTAGSTASRPARAGSSGRRTTRTDPRIPRDPDDLDVAERMGLGAMAAAPLRAPGGEVIGTLAVSYRQPGPISPRPARHAPGARRPRRDRPVELGPARAARGVGGELPRPRADDAGRDLAQRRRGPVHVPRRHRRGAVRLDGRPR